MVSLLVQFVRGIGMAFTTRIMVSRQPVESADVIADPNTGSFAQRLLDGEGEEWSEAEVASARTASASRNCLVALVYVECFGGVCDHWARIYEAGEETKRFEEHHSLAEILVEVGLALPESGYYAPLDLSCFPELPRMLDHQS